MKHINSIFVWDVIYTGIVLIRVVEIVSIINQSATCVGFVIGNGSILFFDEINLREKLGRDPRFHSKSTRSL